MGDAFRDAAWVPSQVVRLREKGQSTLAVRAEAKAIVKLTKEKGIPLQDLLPGLGEECST
jgi:hypothetical protein